MVQRSTWEVTKKTGPVLGFIRGGGFVGDSVLCTTVSKNIMCQSHEFANLQVCSGLLASCIGWVKPHELAAKMSSHLVQVSGNSMCLPMTLMIECITICAPLFHHSISLQFLWHKNHKMKPCRAVEHDGQPVAERNTSARLPGPFPRIRHKYHHAPSPATRSWPGSRHLVDYKRVWASAVELLSA